MGIHLAQTLEAADIHLGVGIIAAQLGRDPVALLIGIGHPDGLAAGQLIQGRHGGINVAVLDQRPHIAEEEGQKQGTDVCAVHVGIGHDDDLVIAQLFNIKFLADTGTHGHDQRIELVIAVNFVRPGLFHVEHLAPHGQNGLETGVAALDGRAGSRVTLDDIQLAQAGVTLVAVLQLVGHLTGLQTGLSADRFSGLFGSFSCPGGHQSLFHDALGNRGILLEIIGQLFIGHAVHQGTHKGVAQLGLGLTLELGLGQLDRNDTGKTLAHILAGEILIVLLQLVVLAGIIVDDAGQRRLEAGLMHTALGGMDVVGEGLHQLVVAVGVLKGDFGLAVLLHRLEIDGTFVQRILVGVQVGHILPDTALIAHGILNDVFGIPAVGDGDAQSGIEEGLLPQTGMQHLIIIDQIVKNLAVGLKGDLGTAAIGGAHFGHLLGGIATGKGHLIDLALLMDFHLQPFRQGVNNRRTNAVQTAGDLIAAAAELTACVQHGENHLQGGDAHLGMLAHGDTAAVVGDSDHIAGQNLYLNMGTEARQRLVDGVVHDLIHQMVQTTGAGGGDVHTGALSDGLQAFQHLNLIFVILGSVCPGDHIFLHKNLRVTRSIPRRKGHPRPLPVVSAVFCC